MKEYQLSSPVLENPCQKHICRSIFFLVRYDDSIKLDSTWPKLQEDKAGMAPGGFVQWSASYFQAANALYALDGWQYPNMHFAGPTMQMTGLAVELALKGLLRGAGATEKKLRSYSHNTYKAYLDARHLFSEVAFVELVFSNTEHLKTPSEVVERYEVLEGDPHTMWRVFFGQLQILDEVYDRPYRSRYIKPGKIVLPEPFIILIGVKLLLNAMLQRLDLPLLPNSDP